MGAAHGRCATEGNTCTLRCRIGFIRGSRMPAAGLSGHLLCCRKDAVHMGLAHFDSITVLLLVNRFFYYFRTLGRYFQ